MFEHERNQKFALKIALGSAWLLAVSATTPQVSGAVTWSANGAPTAAVITGGPWTLEQSGAANGLKSSGYCDSHGNQVGNPGTMRMQPYYFPSVSGTGTNLQGYFDWRPKDTDEAVVAANSTDGGYTWTFQQKVLELRTTCPAMVNKYPNGTPDPAPDPNNSDNGDDDGQGHAFVIAVNGHTYMYTLVRANNHIDVDDLAIHEVTPMAGAPLTGAPALSDAPTDATSSLPQLAFHTTGLLNPDGILGVVPGSNPLQVIYEQKILSGDLTGATALPATQRCSTYYSGYYAANGKLSPNDDITYLRLASTTDGINFKDLGPLNGLNDPTTVSLLGTRWLATAGTIMKLGNGNWGLLFSGGNCIDADSDAFHYIGYAESTDLLNWTVINGLDNPIVSVASVTLTVDSTGAPASGDPVLYSLGNVKLTTLTIPSNPPVVGNAQGAFAGRVYAPSATLLDANDVTVVFAGYHTPKPKNGLGDYRSIIRFTMKSSQTLTAVGSAGN